MTFSAGPSVMLAVAPNGGRKTKADHPALPLSVDELAHCAATCLEAGASMFHLHVRDVEGRHVLDAAAYGEATRRIRRRVGDRLVVQITSEALGRYSPAEQRAVVRAARPEAVSFALRELVPGEAEAPAFADLLAELERERAWPQIILYDPEEARRLDALRRRGLVPLERVSVLYALGRHAPGERAGPADLLAFLGADMPRFDHWTVCAFGPREAASVAAAALLGGHARVGFENNLHLPDGRLSPDNAALVRAVAAPLAALGVGTQSAAALRMQLGLRGP